MYLALHQDERYGERTGLLGKVVRLLWDRLSLRYVWGVQVAVGYKGLEISSHCIKT